MAPFLILNYFLIMEKQYYLKSFIEIEKYIPHELVAISEITIMKYGITSPCIENAKQEAYQENRILNFLFEVKVIADISKAS